MDRIKNAFSHSEHDPSGVEFHTHLGPPLNSHPVSKDIYNTFQTRFNLDMITQ